MKFCDVLKRTLLTVAMSIVTVGFALHAQDSLQHGYKKADFFEVESTKEKIAHLVATGVIKFSRQLSPTKFIVQPLRNDQSFQKRIVGYDWKFSTGNWNPKEYSKFIICFTDLHLLLLELKQQGVVFQLFENEGAVEKTIIQLFTQKDQEILFQSEFVTFIDRADKVAKEETIVSYHDLSVNKVNPIHYNTTLSGEGFGISVKEKSFNSEDIDFKGRYVQSSLASLELSVHANFMTTIAAGGGNSAPNSKGSAWKASVSSSDFTNLFADDPQTLLQAGITAQNHSYGILLESFYGAEARSYDVSVFDNPTLLHVFSAGNSGLLTNETGAYTGLTSYSTLTGNFKMSKNALVVGGHYKDYVVDVRNSHGPAYDGRIKPEVVAYGEEGTSDAAALATGVSVLIQDAYKKTTAVIPPVSLIKASLIAGADDVGASGIDHITGYGAINAAKSVEIIQANQYAVQSISSGQTKTFLLDVPANSKRVKVSLVWTDPAASVGDALALVNDLDLFITDPFNNKTLPWVLSSYPHIDSLTRAPKRKTDRLNNVELVTLENPTQGTYQIHVSGFRVSNSQAFAVAWSFEEMDSFNWTYPLPNISIEANQQVYVRWDNTIEGNGTIEMSVSGGSWQVVEANVPLQQGYYVWRSPSENASVNLRMNTGLSLIETGSFTVSKQLPLKVVYNCENEGMITWDKYLEASTYQLYALGEKYLEPIASTTDTTFIIDKSSTASTFFAVAPVINTNVAYRSFAYNIDEQGVNCYYTTFYGLLDNKSAHLYLQLSTLYNVKKIVIEKQTKAGFVPIGTITSLASNLEFLDSEINPGVTNYRASIELLNGDVSLTDIASVFYADRNTFLVWPNPVKPGEPLTIFTDGQDLSIVFYKTDGRMLERDELVGSFYQPIIHHQLNEGIFFYHILRGNTVVATGKLLVTH